MSRRLAWILALVLLLLSPRIAGAIPPPVPEPEQDYALSPDGHRFRVRFDPASRVRLGVSDALGLATDGAVAQTAAVDVALLYRSRWTAGEAPRHVIWQVDQAVLAGWVAPLRRTADDVPGLDVALYGIALHRHDESPKLVLPMSPPISIPFPFDVGFETEVGRVFVAPHPVMALGGGAEVPMLHVGVLRAALLLDPWRSGAAGRSLEIGVGARYDVDAYARPGAPAGAAGAGPPTFAAARVVHRVAPMTAGSLRFRFQSQDGLLVLDCRGDVAPHWTSEGPWGVLAQASARLERTLLAVNDQPIGAVLEGNYRHVPETTEVEALNDVRVSLGVTVNLQLR